MLEPNVELEFEVDSVSDRAARMLTSGRKVIVSKAAAIKSRGICHRSEEKIFGIYVRRFDYQSYGTRLSN
jgi:hypothetical protein